MINNNLAVEKKRKREGSSDETANRPPAKKQKLDLDPDPAQQTVQQQRAQWEQALLLKGYSNAEISILISDKSPEELINTLLDLHDELIKLPLCEIELVINKIKREDLKENRYYVKIEGDSLYYVLKQDKKLSRLTSQEIGTAFQKIKDAQQSGKPALTGPAYKAIFAAIANKEKQDPNALSSIIRAQIIRIAKEGGSNSLTALKTLYPELEALGLNGPQMAALACCKDGSQKLQLLNLYGKALMAEGVSLEELVAIGNSSTGTDALRIAGLSAKILKASGYNIKLLLAKLNSQGGLEKFKIDVLDAWAKSQYPQPNRGSSLAATLSILKTSPAHIVSAFITWHDEMITLPLYGITLAPAPVSFDQMERYRYYLWLEQDTLVYAEKIPQGIKQGRLSQAEAGIVFQEFKPLLNGSQCQALFTAIAAKENQGKAQDTILRFNHEQLAGIAKRGGENTLQTLHKHYHDLLADGMNGWQIVALISEKSGAKKLDAKINLARASLQDRLVAMNLQEKLAKLNIAYPHYLQWVNDLTSLGYSPKQIEAIVLRPYPETPVNTLITLHTQLIQLPLYGLTITTQALPATDMEENRYYVWLEQDALVYAEKTSQDIKQSRLNQDELGKETFNYLIHSWPDSPSDLTDPLCQALFIFIAAKENQGKTPAPLPRINHEQLADIAKQYGGEHALEALLDRYYELAALGFNGNQIIGIASQRGDFQNIEAVIMHCKELQDKGFTLSQIAQIASLSGGLLNIKAIIDNKELIEIYQLTPPQMIAKDPSCATFNENFKAGAGTLELNEQLPLLNDEQRIEFFAPQNTNDNEESLPLPISTDSLFTTDEQSFPDYLAGIFNNNDDEPPQTQSAGSPVKRTSDSIMIFNPNMYTAPPSPQKGQGDEDTLMPEPDDVSTYFNNNYS